MKRAGQYAKGCASNHVVNAPTGDAQGEELNSNRDMPRDADGGSDARPTRPQGKQKARAQDMGGALRSVYQQTVDEQVPDEMMDLLGKLG